VKKAKCGDWIYLEEGEHWRDLPNAGVTFTTPVNIFGAVKITEKEGRKLKVLLSSIQVPVFLLARTMCWRCNNEEWGMISNVIIYGREAGIEVKKGSVALNNVIFGSSVGIDISGGRARITSCWVSDLFPSFFLFYRVSVFRAMSFLC